MSRSAAKVVALLRMSQLLETGAPFTTIETGDLLTLVVRVEELERALREIASASYGKCPFDGDYTPGPLTPCPVCGDIDDTELPADDPRKGRPIKCHQSGASARARAALAQSQPGEPK